LEDGDKVTLSEIVGMRQEKTEAPQVKGKKNKKGKQANKVEDASSTGSVNGQTFTVIEVINTGSFIIDCDTMKYSPHERDGIVTQQKAHIDVTFKPLKEILDDRTG
jgi:hypothetical protein